MNNISLRSEVPVSVVAAVLVLALATLVYSVLVTQTIVVWLAFWIGVFGIGLSVIVVHLLYRFVVAVETIAENT